MFQLVLFDFGMFDSEVSEETHMNTESNSGPRAVEQLH